MLTKYPHTAFAVLASCFGILFLIFTPPGQSPDDPEHFFRAYHVATGNWLATRNGNLVGGQLPKDLATVAKIVPRGTKGRQQRPADIVQRIHFNRSATESEQTMFIRFPNMALNFTFLYIPQALGINIGLAFNASPIALHYLSRATNLLVWIVLVFYAIKILPMAKWLMLIVALTPMSLFLASSVSADSLTYGICFVFIAAVMQQAFSSAALSVKSSLLLLALSALIALSKFVYIALVALVFLIPRAKFRSTWHYVQFIALCFAAAVVMAFFWSKLMLALYMPASPGETPDPQAQISFILAQPLRYLTIFIVSLAGKLEDIVRQLIGVFGWLDTPLPGWAYVLSYAAIALVSVLDRNKQIRLGLDSKLIILTVITLGTVLIFTGLYVKWTSVGGDFIMGVQGRYFIPLFFLFWLLFYHLRILADRVPYLNPGLTTISFCVIQLSCVSWLLANRYYLFQ